MPGKQTLTVTIRIAPWFERWARQVIDRAVRTGKPVDYAFIKFMVAVATEVA